MPENENAAPAENEKPLREQGILHAGDYRISGLNRINVLLGRNGCGKSTALRQIRSDGKFVDETGDARKEIGIPSAQYVSPERGGALLYHAGMEEQQTTQPEQIENNRNKNFVENFRQQTFSRFTDILLVLLDEIERAYREKQEGAETTDKLLKQINGLLENIEVRKKDRRFEIYIRDGNKITSENISSGEKELISLAIEIIYFAKKSTDKDEAFLLLDEPDVHLHPDLQARLCGLITEIIDENPKLTVIIATHSTAITGALSERKDVNVCFAHRDNKNYKFSPISETIKKILPVFGAHPLSTIFNHTPILLLEGDDDEYIWRIAVKSSGRQLKINPCEVGSKNKLNEYETLTNELINAIYDSPTAYSLRDGDGVNEEIDDVGHVRRFRMACYAAENLLLADDVLDAHDLDWDRFKIKINDWLERHTDHAHWADVKSFQEEDFPRKTNKIKKLHMIFRDLLGSSKSWEVIVGRAIGEIAKGGGLPIANDNSLRSYLGAKAVSVIFGENEERAADEATAVAE